MRHLALLFVFLVFCFAWAIPTRAAETPVVFQGEGLVILHDGSTTAYNPHTDAGRKALQKNRGACCVEAPPGWKGPAETFVFKEDDDRHLPHETRRFVINQRTETFVSSTSLQDEHLQVTDPYRYVDPDSTPAVAFNDEQVAACKCRPGDRVEILEPKQRLKIWAVYANNAGNNGKGLGYTEISAAAASELRIPLTAAKEPLTTGYKLKLRVFPNSALHHFPRGPVAAINGMD
jgi:hypothetical protein